MASLHGCSPWLTQPLPEDDIKIASGLLLGLLWSAVQSEATTS